MSRTFSHSYFRKCLIHAEYEIQKWQNSKMHTYIRVCAHAHTRTHARTQARTHARTHAHTHTHTHTHTRTILLLPRQHKSGRSKSQLPAYKEVTSQPTSTKARTRGQQSSEVINQSDEVTSGNRLWREKSCLMFEVRRK